MVKMNEQVIVDRLEQIIKGIHFPYDEDEAAAELDNIRHDLVSLKNDIIREGNMYAVIVNSDKDDPEIVKFGTKEECDAYLFNVVRPSDLIRNLKKIDCDNGYSFSIEKMERGEWIKRTYNLRRIHNKKEGE